MIDLNNVPSINLSQFFDSVKFRSGSGSGYHLVIDFCIVMFYILMILMKFSFVSQTFFRIFFLGSGFHYKFIGESYSLYAKDIHQIWCRSAKFFENQNSVQNQDQNPDHYTTLDFNTRPTFQT